MSTTIAHKVYIQQQPEVLWLRMIITTGIALISAHWFLYLVLQDKTLYFLTVTLCCLAFRGNNKMLSISTLRSYSVAAAVRMIVFSLLCDTVKFYGAGVLVCLILRTYHEFVEPFSHCRKPHPTC